MNGISFSYLSGELTNLGGGEVRNPRHDSVNHFGSFEVLNKALLPVGRVLQTLLWLFDM